jgi:RNA polymerase primary sigma factor
MSDFINTFNKKEQELINELGRNPTISELTESMPNVGNDVAKKISDLKKIIANPVSLEKPISSDEESHFTDFVKDDTTESIEERIETDERNKELHRVLANKLTPEEDKIICMRTGMKEYPQAMSLDDIAKVLKMKKEKIRQIENKAIKKLKQGLQGSLSLFFDVDK